jgi:hypothetical protein
MSAQNRPIIELSIGEQIRATLDEEWEAEGIESLEREENRLLADRFAEEMALGYTEDDIKAGWAGKTKQEILQAPLTQKRSNPYKRIVPD